MPPARFLRSLGGGDWLVVVVGLALAAILWQSAPQAGGAVLLAILLLLFLVWAQRGFTV